MRVFVTGGTGFIGKEVVNKLKKEGYNLLLLSRTLKGSNKEGIKVIKGNLRNILSWQNQLKIFNPDAAIHIAWEGLPDHSAHISKLNLEYSLNLTELLANIGCKRLIITGSGWEYGPQSGKMSEDTPCKLFDAFTAAKRALHMLGQEIANEKNMEFIWTRLFYVYGPAQQPKALIPHLINSAKSGKWPEIRNPKAKNDFIYVEDVAEALIKILNKGKNNNTYNIGSGKLTSVADIVKYVFDRFGIKNVYHENRQEAKDLAFNYSFADTSKIKREIGWYPKTSTKEGIEKTISYYNLTIKH